MSIPTAASAHPPRNTRTRPTRSTSLSTVKRPTVIASMNTPKAKAPSEWEAPKCSCACRLLQSVADPSDNIKRNASKPSTTTWPRRYDTGGGIVYGTVSGASTSPARSLPRSSTEAEHVSRARHRTVTPSTVAHTFRCSAKAADPMPAPTTLPTENTPWNEAMMGRP
ncbi:Uncharacterised protein [Mycobacteroides abscessus subsp. abscessus]|nr:Uncharacterised protein [Mycobacteroides abscessus subsp. abscessus]